MVKSVNSYNKYIEYRNTIIKIAICSRLLVWLYSVIVAQFMTSFDSSTSLNSVTPFNGTLIHDSTLQRDHLTLHPSNFIDSFIRRVFVKWDSIYYVRIAEYGYEYEQNHAFFPLLPLMMRYLAYFISTITFNQLLMRDYIVLSGFIISNVCFVISCVQLFKLGSILFKDQKYSFIASLLYIINPASIFMSAIYTESIFNMFTFTGLYYLYGAGFYLNSSKSISMDIMPSRRRVLTSFIASILFALATFTRSNGMLLAGFIVFYHLSQLFFPIFKNLFIMANKIMRGNAPIHHTSPILQSRNSHITSSSSSSSSQLGGGHSNTILTLMLGIILIVIQVIIVVSPYLLFQYYGYSRYCSGSVVVQSDSKFGEWPRSWCLEKRPNLYGFVQAYYWNQGFFNYYELKQIPNFALAAPIVILSSCGVISYILYFINHPNDMASTITKLRYRASVVTGRASPSPYYTAQILPFVVHLAFLIVFCTTFMHVQVITRFFSHSPLIFWYAASKFYTLTNLEGGGSNKDKSTDVSNSTTCKSRNYILGYFILYNILGCVLFTNFYPWT